ncbi:NAD-dependent epimerase/dehydratase family protein [Candidatus Sumerlaeota bacterium]
MSERVLVTGGAGFIGSHIVDELLQAGYEVRILDNLEPQVHGPDADVPDYVNPEAEFVRGDVLDAQALGRALEGVDLVSHQAALVGVGQSMYECARYTRVNDLGTAQLLELLVNVSSVRDRVRKVVVASSMSIYGEGKCHHPSCGDFKPAIRSAEQIAERQFEILTPDGQQAESRPTDEEQLAMPASIYAVNKYAQEQMALACGRACGIAAVALRYFGVYGPRQSLSNPYTGVAAIFATRILNGQPPLIFEDGRQIRDFIHVRDIALANRLALERAEADGEVFNVGCGRPLRVTEMARMLIDKLAPGRLEPEISGRFRAGDIRHCYADLDKINKRLGFCPRISFEEGIADLAAAVREQTPVDKLSAVLRELEERGLAQ